MKELFRMKSTMKLFKYNRTSTLILLPKLDEEIWDIQPEDWPNTIRWNAGHIYAEAEGFLHDADHDYEIVNPEWMDLFLDGTRPSEWPETVTAKEHIIEAPVEQEKRIEAFFKGKDDKTTSKVRDLTGATVLETLDDSLQFATSHEGIHLGVMKSLRLAIKYTIHSSPVYNK